MAEKIQLLEDMAAKREEAIESYKKEIASLKL